jgi:hypothetical protein
MFLRQGRKVAKTIYIQKGKQPSDDDELIGYIQDPEIALRVVTAFNFMEAMMKAYNESRSLELSRREGESIKDWQERLRPWQEQMGYPIRKERRQENEQGGNPE